MNLAEERRGQPFAVPASAPVAGAVASLRAGISARMSSNTYRKLGVGPGWRRSCFETPSWQPKQATGFAGSPVAYPQQRLCTSRSCK